MPGILELRAPLALIGCFCALLAAQDIPDPVIYTSQLGFIKGFHHKTAGDFDVIVFLGIPYAEPPIGKLRFQKPRRIANQSKTPISAQKFGAWCYPHHRDALIPDTEYSEDCLFLNVVAPAKRLPYNLQTLSGYPVLLYIHGGGFEVGGAAEYGYKTVSEHFVSRGTVFVSINYRLGFLGFLSDGSHVLPGNLGLWDQTMALQFIHDNVAAFNGDPKRVTVMGHSAGGMGVSALSLSPHSNTLFQRAISLSGAALDGTTFNEHIVSNGMKLIRAADCYSEEPEKRIACLKEKTVDELLDAVDRIGPSRQSLFFTIFHPRFDGDFITDSLDLALRKAPKIASILGTTNMEFAFALLTTVGQPFIWNLTIPESQYDTFSEQDFMHYVNDIVATEVDFGQHAGKLKTLLTAFYFRNDPSSPREKNANFYIERLVEMLTDMHFNIPLYIEAREKMLHGWPVYLYEQEYSNQEYHKSRPVKGAYHTNELPYIFATKTNLLNDFEFTDDDRAFQNVWLETINNFIQTGSPSTEKYRWDKLDKANPSRYYSLTPNPTMKPFYRKDNVHFWTEVVPKEILAKLVTFNLEPVAESEKHGEL